MREVVTLFREEGAVDELGMGRIRDALSNRMFPGISVQWSRARYLMFVPWVFQSLANGVESDGGGTPDDKARRVQTRLSRSLKERAERDGDAAGIIGIKIEDTRLTPADLTWASLRAWGIRIRDIRQQMARREMVTLARSPAELVGEDVVPESIWHPRLPSMPTDFPDGVGLDLEIGEAQFMRDLLFEVDQENDELFRKRNVSLLPALLDLSDVEFDAVKDHWALVELADGSELAALVEKAFSFSVVIRGAQLTYVQLVAESRGDEQAEWVLAVLETSREKWLEDMERRRTQLEDWRSEISVFWEIVRRENSGVPQSDIRFVEEWSDLALENPAGLAKNTRARELIVARECLVKGGKARLRESGRDAPRDIPAPLTFRWSVAHGVVADIRKALGG